MNALAESTSNTLAGLMALGGLLLVASLVKGLKAFAWGWGLSSVLVGYPLVTKVLLDANAPPERVMGALFIWALVGTLITYSSVVSGK